MLNSNTPRFSGLFVQYNDGKDFLMEILNSNPDFRITDFQYITPIAYPIAFIEVEALERTLEDFPVVEKTVLNLIKNQFMQPSIIARVMGLTESYIEKVIKLLFSYGQINENGITEVGLQSLEQNASIKMNTVKQKIQVDGITAKPIDIRGFISDQMLKKPRESGRFVAHLEPVEGVDTAELENLIMSNYTNYINVGEKSLHTNVERINYAKFTGIKYAKAYYLENSLGEAIIMSKAYDSTARNIKDRFTWKPLYYDNDELAKRCNLKQEANSSGRNARESVEKLRHVLYSKRDKTDKDVAEMLSQLYTFNWKFTGLIRNNGATLLVTQKSFDRYDRFVLKMLESLADQGEDYIFLEELYGEYIKVETQDAELLRIAKDYKERSERIGRTYVMNSMERLSVSWKGDMFSLLKNILDNNEQDETNE